TATAHVKPHTTIADLRVICMQRLTIGAQAHGAVLRGAVVGSGSIWYGTRAERHDCIAHGKMNTERCMSKNHGRKMRWGVVALSTFFLCAGVWVSNVQAQDSKKFTLINVIFDGTKIWLPSSLIIAEGDAVELTLINKLDEPHGFQIKAFGI